MLHILLLILKIIGIILGVLLGVILLCLIFVLFVPIRYRAEAKRTEGEGNPPIEVSAKVTWLLHFINIRLDYSTELRVRVRIFLFTLFRLPKKPKKETKEKKKSNKKEQEKNVEKQSDVKNGEAKKQETETQKTVETAAESKPEEIFETENISEPAKEGDASRAESGEAESSAESGEAKPDEKTDTEKTPKIPIKERIIKGIIKIYQILKNIWYTITGICDKIKKIRENIEYYVNVLQSDTFRKSFSMCKEELVSIFSGIRPRKMQADLIIGMDDPASTAKILSYYGILYPFIGGNVNITPDFDEKRIEGFVKIKGKITLFTFMKAAVHIYFSKDIRKLLKLFKKEDV